MRAVVFGTNGELANAIASAFVEKRWSVDQIGRDVATPVELGDVYVFPQGNFVRQNLKDTSNQQIDEMVEAGFLSIVRRLRDCLSQEVPDDQQVDYCLIGSTSAYQGFGGSSLYCGIKFGLRGLMEALNDEYKDTNRRFLLFSMGTMDTAMGRQLTDQDPSTFLSPHDVARLIVSTVADFRSLFQPEVIMRRRVVR